MNHKALLLWIFLQCASALFSSAAGENAVLKGEDSGLDEFPTEGKTLNGEIKYNMRKSLDMDQEGCYLLTGKKDRLEECGFNATAKTIFIIHGWTISGMFENWMFKLVSAVIQRESGANVVVVDWRPMAQQLYPDAVNHTHTVGLDIATMLNWLQDEEQLPLQKVHLIGYSLGAHVAGYAGTYVRGTIGRITGLDPAGPMFEGVKEQWRLSADDADFVDVLHTYTREALGVSIGIQQPVGDIDIYPNGGDVQPGCALSDVLAVAGDFMAVMKCEHERAVHLFVDSLMNKDHMSYAYQCTGPDRFKKGICLSCRKNRCNHIGYNARKMRKRRNSKMYLKTRADTPFGGYHYQMKMHVFNRKQSDNADPTFHVKLYGAQNDTANIFVDVYDNAIGLNLTNTFLVFTEQDIGDLLKIRLSWEGNSTWGSVWKSFKKTLWNWNTASTSTPVLQVRRIRVKAGETQKKFTFCAQDPSKTEISPGESITFVKCRDGWEVKPRKRLPM
ncbi:endothelial lipase isoform X1 [Acanthochromis polyacanthus]|uniref:triacylglycerol lipase n=2 Tax=Acanthochromis polyacanthus TaxID=80966 RepID=A0A3Q1F1J8_9TELE|nr:endothelial lipase isoform X1 [Acanthochromis polyacanthus]